ncbi:MAG: polysaccharide biosynthesis/export family protein [Muribaculaceae bacterium]|nr:polysaccharide biosynthesis/export family protein [Muribaculaceae bacterium]
MNKKIHIWTAALAITASAMLGGCSTPKNVGYFQDFDQVMVIEAQNQRYITVKPDDKLQIIVASKDPQLASIFNLPVVTTRIGQNAAVYSGTSATGYPSTTEGLGAYTVSPEGNIDFPVLGSIHVEGMSRSEVAGFIKGELMGRNLIKDPTVTVEFVNSGVSVLGEVKTPGRYTFNRDQITILDAIAIAGDLDIQGNRENVRVLRKEGNETKVYVVDLTSGKDLYKSPAFYLNQDDIIYVEPNDFRKRQTTVNANTTMSAGFWVSIVSVLTSVAVLVANLVKK